MRELLGGTKELARQLADLEKKLTARLDGHEVAIVDGHISYLEIYWNTNRYLNGGFSFAFTYDPPAGYAYQWSGD